ncbi:hypothetical protein [Mesorhizobium sp. LSHC412B00]|jgi:uncharacterized lipoprotein YbaY|uniref:hypothetical protein n=1 Tax=Mesorhizobium sp. LSHC412B00 TaxID=1287285 RepID=UPI0003CEA9E3|nr:hypothetical protein [Mesorhizobium sp. LSHC412B00]ESX90612.1 hypothetical protein X756_00820 [Mesorhizobium sp. LSHC412B00]
MTDRRTVLMAAGVAAVAAATGAAAAQSPDIRAPDIRATDIRGAVTFVGGKAIPEGHLEIYLEDPAIQDSGRRRAAKTSLKSAGGSKTIEFSLPLPASSTASPTLQVVARLERADGWLVARGSAQFQAGLPVHVTLKAVIY